MKHFRVLQYKDVDELAEAIEKAINDGWELAGQMFTSTITFEHGGPDDRFNQPIIKISPDRSLQWRDCITENCNEPTAGESNYCTEHKPNLGSNKVFMSGPID